MEKDVFFNWIKWQTKHRMPSGDLFKSCLNNCKDKDSLEYYLFMHDLHKSFIFRYVLGLSLTNNDSQKEFYNYMERFKEDDFYKFEIEGHDPLYIPIPEEKDRKIYRTELLDLILPYIYSNPIDNKFPFHEGPYEYKDIKLKEGQTVFDLGASFGLFSAFASSKNCMVHSFEPTHKTVEDYLNLTQAKNPNIKVVEKAVSNITGLQQFTLDERDSRCNGISKMKKNFLNHEESHILIPTITIDDYVDSEKIDKVDFIKADIEGAERLMLEGAKNTLKYFAPDLSICYYLLYDDYKVLTSLIKDINPNYEIYHNWKKIYAKVKHKK